jgi:Tol biopolymer transport system component
LSRQIYLRRVSGGDPLRLTSDPWDDASPAWSPDGSQIAYVGYKEGEHCRLMLVPTLGGAPRELGRCGEEDRSHIAWSHAGDALYFLDDVKGNDRIVRLELATGRRTFLTHPSKSSLYEGEPAVSPDGRWMAFIRGVTGVGDHVILLNMQTGAERQLFARNLGDSVVWAEDSKSVFLENNYHDDFALTNYPLDGSRSVRILSSPEYLGRLSVGPQGLLAVELNKTYDGLARAPAGEDNKAQFIESENGRAFTPNIRPDGAIVAAMKQPSGSGIWVILPTGAMRQIFALDPDKVGDAEPRWSPDGSQIVIASAGMHAIGLQVITSTGALVAAIPFHGWTFTPPVWTADGKSLIFPGFDAKGWRLWRVDIARPGDLRPMPERGWVFVKSRGHELYGVREDKPGVWRIDRTPRQITRLPTLDRINEWAVAGDDIAYVDDPFKPHRQIFAQPIRGGPPRVLAQVPDYAWSDGFEVDPVTGTVIYVAKLSADSDIEILHLAKQ